MKIKIPTLDLLKKIGETTKIEGYAKSSNNEVKELCFIKLEKGFKYHIWGVVSLDKISEGINIYLNAENCKLHYEFTRGSGIYGGGAPFQGYVDSIQDEACVYLSTYIFEENSSTYRGVLFATKTAIE